MSTIVLVGGSFIGAWAWDPVTRLLAGHGHDVRPLTLISFGDRAHLGSTSTTLDTHVTDVTAAIQVADLRQVVLVAHSYAGAPATIAAARITDRIARIIYLAGVLPEPGRTLFALLPPGVEDLMRQLAAAEGDGWRIPVWSDEVLDAVYGNHGLSPTHRALLRARGGGQPINTYTQPAPDDLSAVAAIPRA